MRRNQSLQTPLWAKVPQKFFLARVSLAFLRSLFENRAMGVFFLFALAAAAVPFDRCIFQEESFIGTIARSLWDGGRAFSAFLLCDNEEVRVLRERCLALEKRILMDRIIVEENNRLRSELRVAAAHKGRLASAFVIYLKEDGTMLIAVGREAGILPGQVVVSASGIVGKVEAAGPGFSRVMLVTHPEFRLPVFGEKNGIHGIAAGGSQLSLLHPSSHADFMSGECVRSSGYAGQCPAGWQLGTWDHTLGKIIPSVRLNGMSYVHVFLPPVMSKVAAGSGVR